MNSFSPFKSPSRVISIIFVPCLISASSDSSSIRKLDTVSVSAPRLRSDQRVFVQQEEHRLGLTDDINKILFLQPGIERIPEAGSALLVRGQGLYDTRYEIYGVPMFSTSHFPHNTFCDRSGQMIGAVDEIRLNTRQLAGRYLDASGGVIEVDPGIVRLADRNLKRRPELGFHLGIFGSDVSLSLPARSHDFYQVSGRWTPKFNIIQLGSRSFRSSEDAQLGYGKPVSFGDILFTGNTALSKGTFRQHLWFAYDIYQHDQGPQTPVVPWGMGAIAFKIPTGRIVWDANAGASHQPFFEGKRYGTVVPRKEGTISTAKVLMAADSISVASANLSVTSSFTLYDYHAKLTRSIYKYGTDHVDSSKVNTTNGTDGTIAVSTQLSRRLGLFHFGFDLLTGVAIPDPKPLIDAGAWSRVALYKADIQFLVGTQSSRPDPRGLPSTEYRSRIAHTYSAESKLSVQPSSSIRTGLDLYVRLKDRSPAFSEHVGDLRWDSTMETVLLSRGAIADVSIDIGRYFSIIGIGQVGKSERLSDKKRHVYEWDIPWSAKGILNVHLRENTLELFCTGVAGAGLPYRDIVLTNGSARYAEGYSRVQPYGRLDLKAHFKQPVERHRWLTKYEVYAEINNILSIHRELKELGPRNVREYYWDENLEKRPITLDPFFDLATINLGARFGFRL